MVQRKGNMPVKDSRGSKERAQQGLDIMAAVSMVRVPTAPPILGNLPPYSAEGTGGCESELEPIREPRKSPARAGQYPL